MTFLAPWMLGAGVLAALAIVALHLLTTRRPPPAILPTARFVPESDVRAVARAARPTDLVLLALRALAVLAIGAAFARPVLDAPGPTVRTIVALEWTRALADAAGARQAARAVLGEGGALVLFDTAARVVEGNPAAAIDSLGAPAAARGALSPMFVAARDAAARIARGADSVRLVVVSAAGGGALDAATERLRDEWPGRVEFVRLAAVADTARAARPGLVTVLADDPLAPALERLRVQRGAHAVRVVRAAATAADSAWLRGAGARAVLLVWPLATADPVPDGVTAFGAVAPATLVAPLTRLEVPAGRVVARWRDGASAATESAFAAGCVRHVGIGVPIAGDLTLRAPFTEVLAALVEPCGGARAVAHGDSTLTWLTRAGPLASGPSLVDDSGADRTLPLALLLAALALLAVEQFLRRRPAREVAA